MNNFGNRNNYGHAQQDEGKGTYEGLRRSQHMVFLRILFFFGVVVLLAWIIVMIQGNVEGHPVTNQVHRDYNFLIGSRIGKFSTCDLDHNCHSKNKTVHNPASQGSKKLKNKAKRIKNNRKVLIKK